MTYSQSGVGMQMPGFRRFRLRNRIDGKYPVVKIVGMASRQYNTLLVAGF